MGRQLRHWTKKVRQPFGAPTSGVRATGATTPGDDDFEAGLVQAWFTQLVKATQGTKQGTMPGGPRKPPVPPKPNITPSARKKLKFTSQVSSAELAQELPFSEEPGTGPWDTPSERVGIEFHWSGYQYMGPGTHLKKRLARGDPGINQLDRIAKAHDIDYDKAKNLQDKRVADRKMIAKIDRLPGRKTLTERIVKNIMKAKLKLGM